MVQHLLIGFILLAIGATPIYAQNFVSRVIARDMGNPIDVNAHDYDSDGDIDLMVSTWTPGGVSYCNRLLDTLDVIEAYVASGGGRQITSGDFDHDGDMDVVFASYNEDRLVMMRNGPAEDPADRFTNSFFADGIDGPFALLSGDFCGDAGTDLIASELQGADRVRLFQQIGGSQEEIWSSAFPSGVDPLGLAIADLDDDGVNEILVAGGSSLGGLFVMRRTQNGGYSLTRDIPNVYLAAIAVADLDADGFLDVVGCDFESDVIRRWEQTANGWTSINLSGGLNRPRDVVIEDFDTDGLLDFAASGEGQTQGGAGGGVSWWRQQANGSFVSQNLSNQSGFFGLEAVDYDRDGDVDLVAANRELEQVVLLENRMGTPTRIIGHVSAVRGGNAVEGVRVTAVETGVSGFSDASGRYELGMIEGVFTLRFEHPCWQTENVSGVQTFADDTTNVDQELRRPVMELPVTSLNLFVQNDLTTSYELWVDNSGDAPLTISSVTESIAPLNDWVTVAPSEIEIPAGLSGLITVTLTPDTTNDAQYEFLGSLILHSNSCPDTVVDLALVITVLDVPEREIGIIPTRTTLARSYPNPFNATVNLPVEISAGEIYSLRIYDVLGREVSALHNGLLTPGRFVFQWNAIGNASGRYIAVLGSASGARWETPLTLIK